jgi:sporulation protein YlmC with PRC-barrel domain
MAEMTRFEIGADASCTDGPCGTVTRMVVDPVARVVTHLVVEPRKEGLARLVPIDLVDAAPDRIRLHCTQGEFDQLDYAEETQFVPGAGGSEDYDQEQVMAWPYYGLGGAPGITGAPFADIPQVITYDTVPLDEVEVRRGEHVHATDGSIGRVHGLVIDPRNHHVTHILLAEGHLWGRKEVAIPIGAVTGIDDAGIQLNLTKQQVQDLPPVDIDHPG